jgi:hypothetical protein
MVAVALQCLVWTVLECTVPDQRRHRHLNDRNRTFRSRVDHGDKGAAHVISEPNSDPQDDDKECQDAIEAELLALIDRAVQAGWQRHQVIRAINDLAAGLWFDEQKFAGESSGLPVVGTFPID